jgi:phytanoyl-CoA hydroxylase
MLTVSKLSSEQIAFYKSNGYIKIENAVSADVLENVRQGYRNAVNGEYLENGWENCWKKDELLQLPSPHEHIPEYQNKEHIEIIVEYARQLEDESINFWYDQLIYKPAGNKWETPWHQDAGYWQGKNSEVKVRPAALTGWLAVEDVDESMGCMTFVPGSHKNGRYNHKDVSDVNPIGSALMAEANFDNAIKMPMKAGDITIHDQYTLHYTTGNSGQKDRCGLVNHMRSVKEET